MCLDPLKGWRSSSLTKNGKRGITFKFSEAYNDLPIKVPCGQCIECRLEKSRQWAMRCVHEAQMHEYNSFITLTYNDENLPTNGSLQKHHFQKFMKRLRKKLAIPIRFFHCGEYGDMLSRPHYHACIFGYDFPDKKLWSVRENIRLYRSDLLESVWTYGHSIIGDVTFDSAAYVARYVMKKVTGKPAEAYYQGRTPEYITMSRRPGIGAKWFEKYNKDVYPVDEIIMNDYAVKPPKFYDSLLDVYDHDMLQKVKVDRIQNSKDNIREQGSFQYSRGVITEAKIKMLKRNLSD